VTQENLQPAMAFLQDKLSPLASNDRRRMLNAADEVLSNVFFYSQASEFTLSIELTDDRCRLILVDDGVPYNPLSHTDPLVHDIPLEQRPIGGLGILISKKLMDDIRYQYQDKRNHLSMLIFRTFTETQQPA